MKPRESLSSALTRRLEQLILDGTLKPGRKMPSERQLAERLGVSRNILREALKTLRGRSLIETRHGQGSVVVGLVPNLDPQSPLSHLFRDHPRTLYDLLEVRELLEGRAAYLAAERATDADIHCITLAFEALEQAPSHQGNPEAAAKLDHAFHKAIYEASHNPVLIHTLESLLQPMASSVLTSVNNLYHRTASKKQIDRHHRQIYNAIASRQPDWAQKAATVHIVSIRERLRDIEKEEQRLVRSIHWDTLAGS